MDDLNAVRDLLAAPPPSPQVSAEGRARLVASFTAQPTAPNPQVNLHLATQTSPRSRRATAEAGRRRGAPRTARWTALGVGLLGAASAVIVVITSGTAPGGPDSTTLAQPPSADASTGSSARPDAKPSARQILLAAATSVARTSANGDYWVNRVVSGSTLLAPNGKYLLEQAYSEELWASPEAGKPTWLITQFLGAKPATPEDKEAWRADGSPKTWTYPGKRIAEGGRSFVTESRTVTAAAGPREARREVAGGSLGMLTNGEPMTPDRLGKLPATPEELRDYLESVIKKQAADGNVPPLGQGRHADLRIYDMGVHIIMRFPVSPKVRAAAYRMIASLPGVTAVGEVTDPLGRRGRAVSIPRTTETGESEGVDRLVVDAETGLPLALENTAWGPSRQGAAGFSYFSYEAVKKTGWTDEKPDLPANRRGPEDAAG
ncbi:CU044_5270 family protein [Streptosporangium sp. CA-135522]|uniref:CU044_5270 family protein n=1 Tax=Streptosporangium sp. CA-135522 TaxID=3240072 RepID=UPI003D8E008C